MEALAITAERTQVNDVEYRQYECGTEIRQIDSPEQHELPDECPACGADFSRLVGVSS